jgi:hypothetical protein
MKIALVKGGVVQNIILSDPDFALSLGYDQAIEVGNLEAGIGWGYDGERFISPPVQNMVKPSGPLTKFQFISRLTMDERVAIYSAEDTSPVIKMWLEMFRICEEIELDNPDTRDGVRMLEALGFIAAGRAEAILNMAG